MLDALREQKISRPEIEKDLLYRDAGLNGTLGRPSETWKIYAEIAEKLGKDDGLLGKMAAWYKSRKKPEEARKIYAEFKDQIAGLKNIAAMDLKEGKIKEAMEIFRKLGEQKEAIVLYNQCKVVNKSAPEATLQIGFTYEEAKDKEKAIRTFQLTCKRYPKSGQASKAHAHLQNEYNINVTLGGAEE